QRQYLDAIQRPPGLGRGGVVRFAELHDYSGLMPSLAAMLVQSLRSLSSCLRASSGVWPTSLAPACSRPAFCAAGSAAKRRISAAILSTAGRGVAAGA